MYGKDWELEAIDCIRNNKYVKFRELVESAKGTDDFEEKLILASYYVNYYVVNFRYKDRLAAPILEAYSECSEIVKMFVESLLLESLILGMSLEDAAEKQWRGMSQEREDAKRILQTAYDRLVGVWLEEDRFVDTEFMSELIRSLMRVDIEAGMKCWDDFSRKFLAIENRNYNLGYYVYYHIGVSFWYVPGVIPVRKARALNQYPELRRAYFQEYDYSTGFIVSDLYREGPLENFIEYFQLMCTNPNRGEGDGLDTYQGFIESIARVHPRSKKEYDYMVQTCGEAFRRLNPRKPSNTYPYWYTSPSEEDDSVSTEINFDTSGLEQVAEDLKHIATVFEGLASGELVIADDEDQDDDWADGYDDDMDEDDDYEEDDIDWADDNDDDDEEDDDYDDHEFDRLSRDFRELDTLTEDVLIARGHNPADYTILSGRNPLDDAFGFDDKNK